MKTFVLLAAVLQIAVGGFVSVRMPYANPAGVTYINGVYQGHEYPVTYAAAAPPLAPVAAPLQYQYPLRYPAKIEAHHVGYAAAQVPAVAAVPVVKHVPTVSHVPVTRYEAQPAVIEKQLDVAKPAVTTRKFEVRRPAIQKQFYDIEERVIVRPAGSAVVELDEPTSKLQRGPAVVQPLEANHYAVSPFTHNLIAQAASFAPSPSSPSAIPVVAHAPVHVTVAPVISHAPVSNFQNPPSTPAPVVDDSAGQGEQQTEEDQSVVVENADFRSQQRGNLFRSAGQNENAASRSQERVQQEYYQNLRTSQVNAFVRQSQSPNVFVRPNGVDSTSRFIAHDPNPTPSVLPSVRGTSEESRNNQQKLIDLLTARGGVAEVGYSRDGVSHPVGDAGHVRARVISATPAPQYAEPAGERVSTRRVVVSRPIETLQEVDVVEPATKVERISVQHPTLIKTARLDHIQVHGSVPVVGKAFAPAVAHAAVPVYQKTISPAYGFQ